MPNQLQDITPKLLAQGLMTLRGTCVMPRLVNRDLDVIARQKGSTVDVPVPSAIPIQDVLPNNIAPSTGVMDIETVPVKLDNWKEAPFYLTDKDMKTAMMGTIPMQASEAVSSLAEAIDAFILDQYKGVYGFAGTPGVDVFGALKTKNANRASMVLNQQRAPKANRRMVLDPVAEASALDLRAFQDMSFNGMDYGIKEGMINRKLGFDWFMDQNVKTHTKGVVGAPLVDGTYVAGVVKINISGVTTKPAEGDVFTIAGHTQTYAVKSSTLTSVTFAPGLKAAPADDAVLTFKNDHTVNLAFHRDAFAFASRPLEDEGNGLGNIISSQVDPVSGLSLRLEISREHKRTRFSYDVLYGGALVRPELAVRLAG